MTTNIYGCPHCGRGWLPQWRERHAAICPHDPAVLARVRAFLEDPDQPGVARAQTWYTQNSPRHGGLPERKALTAAHGGTWRGVCRALGLEPGQSAGFRAGTHVTRRTAEARAIAEVEEALIYDRGVRSWVWDRGLTVLDTPRQLPDGRLAWMVR